MEEGGKEKGKTAWTVELVIYSTFGPEAFLTNYTQASKPGCKYISNQLNTSLFAAQTSPKAPKRRGMVEKSVTVFHLLSGAVAKTTEPCHSCPEC